MSVGNNLFFSIFALFISVSNFCDKASIFSKQERLIKFQAVTLESISS